MQKISKNGRKFIEEWEECVLYVYDDKVKKRRINGHLQYPEWNGWQPIGTLTIGYGHTNAAGPPKIVQGMHLTKEEADELLDADLEPCESSVRRIVKKPLTQGQFDALVSFTFNCGAGNLKKLVSALNASGDYQSIPRRMMQYVTSKGERMPGLVNRRAGEVRLWSTPDDPEEAESMEMPVSERDDPPKPITQSKTANAAIAVGSGGIIAATQAAGDAASTIKSTKDNIKDLGVFDFISAWAHSPVFWVCIIVIAAAVFIYWDRNRKLRDEHI